MSGNLSDMLKASLLMNQKEGNPIYTFLLLTIFEFIIKYITQGIEFGKNILEAKFKKKFSDTLSKNMPDVLNTDPNEIEFERKFTNKTKSEDFNKVDAILHHITSLPHIKKIIYSRSTYLINYKENVAIDDKIFFQLSKIENDAEGEIVAISFKIFTNKENTPYLKQFVDTCEKDYIIRKKNKLGESLYFFDHHVVPKSDFSNSPDKERPIFTKNLFVTNRTFKNIFFESKQHLENRVNFFMNRKQWYDAKGIPHCLGLLLHGSPGCGKTSTIKAIANVTNRHIININLSKIKSKTQLKSLFYDEKIAVLEKNDVGGNMEHYIIPIDHRLFIIEDVDCLDGDLLFRRDKKKEKEKKKKQKAKVATPISTIPPTDPASMYAGLMGGYGSANQPLPSAKNPRKDDEDDDPDDKIDLSSILNILDGTLETPGRILIITSNYPEKLDQALVRPGRIDMIIEFKKCNRAIITEMYESFYEASPNQEDINKIDEYKWTPAETSQILFKNFYDPDQALHDLINNQPETYFKFSYFKDESDTISNTTDTSSNANDNQDVSKVEPSTIVNDEADVFIDSSENPSFTELQKPINNDQIENNLELYNFVDLQDQPNITDWQKLEQNQQIKNKFNALMEINKINGKEFTPSSLFIPSVPNKINNEYHQNMQYDLRVLDNPSSDQHDMNNTELIKGHENNDTNINSNSNEWLKKEDPEFWKTYQIELQQTHDQMRDQMRDHNIVKTVNTYISSEYGKDKQHDIVHISNTIRDQIRDHIFGYIPPEEVQKLLDKYLYLKN